MSVPVPFSLNDYPLVPGKHLLEASAGTGKTFSLVGLMLRFVVEEGMRLPEILAVTFTKKATGELADRLRRKLAAAKTLLEDETAGASKDPQLEHWRILAENDAGKRGELLKNIRLALAESDNAPVFTIHGFCRRVLQDYAFECDLPLELDMEDAGEAFTRTAVRDFLRELYAPLADPAASEADKAVARHIRNELGIDEDRLTSLAKHLASGATFVPAALLATYEKPKKPADIPCFDEFYAARDAEVFSAAASDDSGIPALFGRIGNLRGRLETLAGRSTEAHRKAARESLEDFVALAFEKSRRTKLAALKAEARTLTFDDLIARTADAVKSDGDVVKRLRERFQVVLVDEFQDTDEAQTRIFETVFDTGTRRLFYIGDPKQSIYRFRGADVNAYLAARTGAKEAVLDTNRRSSKAMVEAANALFAPDAGIGKKGLFDDVEGAGFSPVKAGAEGVGDLYPPDDDKPVPPLTLVFVAGDNGPVSPPARAEKIVVRDTGARIAALLSGYRIGDRPVNPGDIAVLVDSHRNAVRIRNRLRDLRIPATRTAGSVFADPMSGALRRLMLAMLSPRSATRIRAALAGPLFGLSAADLRALDSDEGAGAYQEIVDEITDYAALWKTSGFESAMTAMAARRRIAGRLLPRKGGERAMADFRQLVELVNTGESARHLSPEATLVWLESRIRDAARGDFPADSHRQRLESDGDRVAIMTMHASKGLEFPVVFVPFAWKFPSKSGRKDRFASARMQNGDRSIRCVGIRNPEGELAAREEEELADEKARLLYVAVTRAKSACFLYSGEIAAENRSSCIRDNPLGLLGPIKDGDGIRKPATKARPEELFPCTLKSGWLDFVARHPGLVRLSPATTDRAPEYRPADDGAGKRAGTGARRLRVPIDRKRIGASYSGISNRLGDTHAAFEDRSPRHDERRVAASPETLPVATLPDGETIHDFPRGAAVGDAVHGLLEEHDFTRPFALPDVVRALKINGIADDRKGLEGRRAALLRERLDAWLASPLDDADGEPFTLNTIAPEDRIAELGFDLPARFSSGAPLADALERVSRPAVPASLPADLRAASLPPLDGYLTGFIDLVFRRKDRYYILDWKTNRLGANFDAYTPERIAAAMEEHRYHLQYRFYLVALDAHLRASLGAGYDPAKHLGGVRYLFVRGLDPALPGNGVFRADAEPEAVAAMAAALRETQPVS